MNSSKYAGTELELFAEATVWKAYLARCIHPFLGARILEVGAGVGGTTQMLVPSSCEDWCCLEPDQTLGQSIEEAIRVGNLPGFCRLAIGTLPDLPKDARFNTVLYIDVLEHIADDQAELAHAAERLSDGGYLVVVSPAHQWLFTPFDEAIGHFRRYEKCTLLKQAPPSLELVRFAYLDSMGMLASIANRFLLHSAMPRRGQIAFWDKVLVRLSRVFDPLTRYSVGKSVLAVWRKTGRDS